MWLPSWFQGMLEPKMVNQDKVEVEDGIEDELWQIEGSRGAASGPAQVQSLCI